jgi:acetyl esterase
MPAYHPDVASFLAMLQSAGRPPFQSLSPAEARAAYAAGRPLLQPPPEEVAAVRDLAIPGPGGPLPLRLYRGAGCDAATPQPALLFLHGGGWVIGDLESHDGLCRRLANAARCHVVAVDYRLAPEHRFPAAVEDAAAALRWLAAEAPALGIDRARMAVGGDSAGGNLAAVLALMGRDGTLPSTGFQLLLYPVLDLSMATPSYARVTEGVPLTAATMRYFADHYLPPPADREDWRASPARAASLAGTPPAFVLTAGHDPLADEGRDYARRLEAEGVRVAALHLSDQLHGVLTMGRIVAFGEPVLQLAAAALRDAWDRGVD